MTADAKLKPKPAEDEVNDPGFGELRAGHLGVRIATTEAEIDAVQALRWRIFYEEMKAEPSDAARALQRDVDAFDAVADHLVVVDHAIGPGAEGVVGTYRRSAGSTPTTSTISRRSAASRASCWNSGGPASPRHTARARSCSSCGAASPPMCSVTRST